MWTRQLGSRRLKNEVPSIGVEDPETLRVADTAELLSEKGIFGHRSTDALTEQELDGSISLRDRSPVTLDGDLHSGPVCISASSAPRSEHRRAN